MPVERIVDDSNQLRRNDAPIPDNALEMPMHPDTLKMPMHPDAHKVPLSPGGTPNSVDKVIPKSLHIPIRRSWFPFGEWRM